MQEVESSSTSFPAVVFPTLKGQNTQHQIFAAGKAKGLSALTSAAALLCVSIGQC